ncbi:penicillin acylase family protein [Steroidobacter agaridevorans]|uniref:penicillin acylase family protein n=1 Tax=Steroidobacter agaridevorans TaxID=2695856 RepID=UPI00137A9FD1|nr:penicillin acylase family protein [Steroidobacter agaridevorans]
MTSRIHRTTGSAALMLACAAVTVGCSKPASNDTAASKERYNATVRWTAHGMPHIKADDWGSLGYGFAYAVATDAVCTLAREFVNARGEQSKFFGPEDGRLEADIFHKSVITDQALAHAVARVPEEMAALQAGYVAGYNRYLADHTGEQLPASCRNQPWVKPIEATDMTRMGIGVGIRYGLGRSPAAIANAAPPTKDEKITFVAPPAAEDVTMYGSNAIALGKQATVNGKGLLLGNPHYPWSGGSRFHMAHLTVPGELDVMGVGLITTPFVSIGFNHDVAWSHTVSTGLRYTLYELTLDPKDPLTYRYGDETRKLTSHAVNIDVKQPDGSVKSQEHTTYHSHFGPMLEDKDLPWTRERAYAIRDSNLDNNRSTEQYLKFARARSVGDMLAAMQTSQGVAWVNTIAADRQGTALYADLSVVPNVDEALLKACASATVKKWGPWPAVVMRGAPDCEWRIDQRAQQPGILPAEQSPHLVRDDYVTNSNDSYWLSNPSQPLEGYSPIIGPERTERSLRTRAGLVFVNEVLQAKEANRFDAQRLQDLLFSHRNFGAELVLDDVLAICKHEPKTVKAEKSSIDVTRTCEVLAAWDRKQTVTSRGAQVWTEAWPLMSATPNLWAVPFDANDPVRTPRQLNASDATVRKAVMLALATATQKLNEAQIPLDAPWGEVQYTEHNGEKIGIPGGAHATGMFSMVLGKLQPGKGYTPIVTGNSWMQVVTWTDRGEVDARGLLSYSQSEEEDSAFVSDQTKLYSIGQWLKLPFMETEIAADTVRSLELKGS